MELLKYVYLYAQKSIIKAGNNKFQDLINVPRRDIEFLHLLCRVHMSTNSVSSHLYLIRNLT